MATTDLQIQSAVAAQILPLSRSDGSHVVPQTTLTTTVTPGVDKSVQLADVSHLSKGSSLSFDDALGEERLYVSRAWDGSTTVPCDLTNLGYSALKYAHIAGTLVYSNLFDITPWQITPGLMQGDAVIFVRVLETPYRTVAMPSVSVGTFTVAVQYHRLLNATGEEDGQRIEPNNWAERQERLARGDVALITNALLANEKLIGQTTPAIVLKMAAWGSADNKVRVTWHQETMPGDTTHLFAVLTAIYIGLP